MNSIEVNFKSTVPESQLVIHTVDTTMMIKFAYNKATILQYAVCKQHNVIVRHEIWLGKSLKILQVFMKKTKSSPVYNLLQ